MKKYIELLILWTIYRFFKLCGTDGLNFGFDQEKCAIQLKVKDMNRLANEGVEFYVRQLHANKEITDFKLEQLLMIRKMANSTRLRLDIDHAPFVRKCIYHYWLVTSMLAVHKLFCHGFITIPLDQIHLPDEKEDRDKEVRLYNCIVYRLLNQKKGVIYHEKVKQ